MRLSYALSIQRVSAAALRKRTMRRFRFYADIACARGKRRESTLHPITSLGENVPENISHSFFNGKGKVAVIDQPILTSVLDRVAGFKSAIEKYPDSQTCFRWNGMEFGTGHGSSLRPSSSAPRFKRDIRINDESALGALDAVLAFKRMNIVIVGTMQHRRCRRPSSKDLL